MENIREIVRENLVKYRKKNKLTQMELSEKISYSDKAISRWETGEVTPDIETLNALSELYGINISAFFEKESENITDNEKANEGKEKAKNKIHLGKKFAISLISIVSVWLLPIIIFALSSFWQIFLWFAPITFILATVFSALWGKRIFTVIFSSLICWTFIAALYVQLLSSNVWMLWIIGVPIQIVILLGFFLKPTKKEIKNTTDVLDVIKD